MANVIKILDDWVFNVVKDLRNYWILEKEGKIYKVNKSNKKFERLYKKR